MGYGMRPHFFLALLFFLDAHAKVPSVSIDDLAEGSQEIIRGRVMSCVRRDVIEICRLSITKVYKGSASLVEVDIHGNTGFSEVPRLEKIAGHEVVVFLSYSKGGRVIYDGYRGLIRIEDGKVYPGVVDGLPERMSVSNFERLLSSIISQSSLTR